MCDNVLWKMRMIKRSRRKRETDRARERDHMDLCTYINVCLDLQMYVYIHTWKHTQNISHSQVYVYVHAYVCAYVWYCAAQEAEEDDDEEEEDHIDYDIDALTKEDVTVKIDAGTFCFFWWADFGEIVTLRWFVSRSGWILEKVGFIVFLYSKVSRKLTSDKFYIDWWECDCNWWE